MGYAANSDRQRAIRICQLSQLVESIEQREGVCVPREMLASPNGEFEEALCSTWIATMCRALQRRWTDEEKRARMR